MSITRAYYSISLTPQTVSTRPTAARAQGIVTSSLAHETPQVVTAPDATHTLARLHWDSEDPEQDRDLYESLSHVTLISSEAAEALRRTWSPTG